MRGNSHYEAMPCGGVNRPGHTKCLLRTGRSVPDLAAVLGRMTRQTLRESTKKLSEEASRVRGDSCFK
jgi:hypothetical protein